MSDAGPRAYNQVYEELVRSDDDIVGLVAYSLYKQHKRDWLIKYRETYSADPGIAHVDAFLLGVRLPEQLEKYRKTAADALIDYAQASLSAEEPRIREEAISERVGVAAGQIEAAGRWHRQIVPGIAAAAIWTLFLIALGLLLKFAGIDLLDVLQSVSAETQPP